MWDRTKKTVLSIIYGDDLTLVGDVVVSRDEEKKTCQIINQDGELLVPDRAIGVGYFLGSGGFHYVVITESKEVNNVAQSNTYVSPMANSRHYSNFMNRQEGIRKAASTTSYTEYSYKIFNSKFEFVNVGKTRSSSPTLPRMTLEVGGKMLQLTIASCILKTTESLW